MEELTQNPGPKLFKALCAFQATNPKALMNKVNPHFKSNYAPLEQVMAVAHSMTAHGLCVSQLVSGEEVITLLAHESGEFITSRTPIVAQKNTAQGYGSGVTYARRYALGAIIGIASEPDDDGNAATAAPPQRTYSRPAAPKPTQQTDKQRKWARAAIRDVVGAELAPHVSDWLQSMGRTRVGSMDSRQVEALVAVLKNDTHELVSKAKLAEFAELAGGE